ncbi:MAG: hypothetical protein ABWY20_22730 [Mycobacterium sp.]
MNQPGLHAMLRMIAAEAIFNAVLTDAVSITVATCQPTMARQRQ